MDYLDGFQYSKTESPNTGGGGSSEMFSARAMQPQTFSPEQSGSEKGAPKTADLQFLPTAEGFYDYINDQYIYQYKDHLGNVRVIFARNSAGGLQLKDNNDYYPFGMNHLKTGNSYFGVGSYVKYKFNGVEIQETGLYAMEWRNYQADVARFSGVDQLSESYDSFSPYHFAMNNPVLYSDPTGMYSTDHNGNYSTTNTAEISKLQSYFGSGGSVDGVESFVNENDVFKEDIQEVIVNVTGKGNKDTWNLGGNYLFNSYTLYNGILKGLNNWNFQTKAGAMSESLVGMRNDGGVMMIGGYGDPLGLFDIGGQVISTWKPQNRYLAMGVGLFAAIALKKPGLATKELSLETNLAEDLIKVRHHTSQLGLKGIKNSGSINASRGLPYGVDVEIAPFIKATKAQFGQAGTGSYIEFSVPKSLVGPPAPGYMGGTGTAGRIVTYGTPFNLKGTAPKFVRWNWLGF